MTNLKIMLNGLDYNNHKKHKFSTKVKEYLKQNGFDHLLSIITNVQNRTIQWSADIKNE